MPQTSTLPIAAAPGLAIHLTIMRFGTPGARPKTYIQGGLHADEVPGMLAAHHLCQRLTELEAAGQIRGEIVVVPLANPIGLSQRLLGASIGRFDLRDGGNFNRGYPVLTEDRIGEIGAALGPDAGANTALIRAALLRHASDAPGTTPAQCLKRALLGLAADADIVLDLHCDGVAAMHLYGLTPQAHDLTPLSRLLGSTALLVATESGDDPFDEACSRPWLLLQERFPEHPIALGCLATTVELRGGADVRHDLAAADAASLIGFLQHRGCIAGDPPPLPEPRCEPTPLAGLGIPLAAIDGIFVHGATVGVMVHTGQRIGEVVDPLTGQSTDVTAPVDGVLFAMIGPRFVMAGQRLGKVAGRTALRSGLLLSP